GYLAGSDELRTSDLHEMFLDEEVKAILCLKGGYGCSRLVDKLDYELIKQHPKLLIGFSDITVLINAIYQQTGLPMMHGAVGIYLGSPSFDASSLDDFAHMLFSPQLGRVLKNPHDDAITLNPGLSSGVLVGGNLSLIAALQGTAWDIPFKNKIVLIEDVDEAPYRLDRFFASLRLSGKLREAVGFVFGYFTGCEPKDPSVWDVNELIDQYFKPLGVPVVKNFASGHNYPFLNLPIGLQVELNADTKTITILEELYASH
ncbi:MAG TPA: LD-carboxypeptidase, partial [Bacilli bacterium]|nr:LD-carboxypeptidase [Bacilli bacterium]